MILKLYLMVAMSVARVASHGYLRDPPSRNNMWRAGFDSEPNYNDHQLNCGGFENQWETNGGKCGVCGDPYQGPREHEAGGKYAAVDRSITRCYSSADDVIDIHVRLHTYHQGYFEFHLCEHNSMGTRVNQSCFDNGFLLTVRTTGDTRFDVNNNMQEHYYFQLDMPRNVTCSQCILKWVYTTGNRWGCDDTGCGMGIGNQEQFINCADIAILENCAGGPITPGPTNPTAVPPVSTTEGEVRCWGVGQWNTPYEMESWCKSNCLNYPYYCPEALCQCNKDLPTSSCITKINKLPILVYC